MLEYFELNMPLIDYLDEQATANYTDYVYNYGAADDWFLGAWGLVRTYACDNPPKGASPPIRPLPDNPVPCPQLARAPTPAPAAGNTAAAAAFPGEPCRTTDPKSFSIVAINKTGPTAFSFASRCRPAAYARGPNAPAPKRAPAGPSAARQPGGRLRRSHLAAQLARTTS
jgi:hypothetical protein